MIRSQNVVSCPVNVNNVFAINPFFLKPMNDKQSASVIRFDEMFEVIGNF